MFALPVKQKQEGGLKQKALSILGSAVLAESFTVTNGIKERKISEKGTERFLYFLCLIGCIALRMLCAWTLYAHQAQRLRSKYWLL